MGSHLRFYGEVDLSNDHNSGRGGVFFSGVFLLFRLLVLIGEVRWCSPWSFPSHSTAEGNRYR